MAIAADATTASAAGGGPTFFKVTIEPAQPRLQLANGAKGALAKGMTLSARFFTARRTLLEMIYQDASLWLDPRNLPAPHEVWAATSR